MAFTEDVKISEALGSAVDALRDMAPIGSEFGLGRLDMHVDRIRGGLLEVAGSLGDIADALHRIADSMKSEE